jgi:hypothetical protein
VILPLIMCALFGEQVVALRAEIEPHVEQTVTFLLPPAVMATRQSLIVQADSYPPNERCRRAFSAVQVR